MKRDEFEKLVVSALEDLPRFFRDKMNNVSIVIEDKPTKKQFNRQNELILGLYQGVPLSDRTHLYGMVMPDKITLFKKNIELVCRTDAEIRKLVIRTVQHELAHHFGISDERLREMGKY